MAARNLAGEEIIQHFHVHPPGLSFHSLCRSDFSSDSPTESDTEFDEQALDSDSESMTLTKPGKASRKAIPSGPSVDFAAAAPVVSTANSIEGKGSFTKLASRDALIGSKEVPVASGSGSSALKPPSRPPAALSIPTKPHTRGSTTQNRQLSPGYRYPSEYYRPLAGAASSTAESSAASLLVGNTHKKSTKTTVEEVADDGGLDTIECRSARGKDRHTGFSQGHSRRDASREEEDADDVVTIEPPNPHSKMTVTIQSPRECDKREVSVHPHSYYHSHQDSDSALASGLSTPGESDGGDSDDDYDWSGEEDLVDQQEKFNSQMGHKTKQEGWGIKRIVHFLFSTLVGSTFLAGLLITPPLIVHFYWFKPHPTEKRRYIDKNVQAWLFWAAANVVISWCLAMIIDIIPILVRYFLAVAWGHVSEAVKSRLETYDSVKGTAKPAFYAASCLASWVIIFDNIYSLHTLAEDETSAAPYTDRVYQGFLFLFFFTLVICAQKMMSHYVAWNFHQQAYKERIEDIEKSLSVIEKLQKYSPKQHKRYDSGRTGQQAWQKDHYRMLNSALRSEIHPDTTEQDLEAVTNALNEKTKAKKKRRPIFGLHGKGGSTYENRNSPVTPEPEMEDIRLEDMHPPALQETYTTRHTEAANHTPHHRPLPSATSYPPSSRQSFDGLTRPGFSRRTTGSTAEGGGNSRGSGGEGTLVHAAKLLKQAVLHDARNLQGRQEDLSGLGWNVNSSKEAKRLAKSIFRKLKDRYRKYLIAADFYPAFPTKEEAEEAFRTFDTDANGDLSRAEIKIKLVKTYQERRFLSRSLKDVGEALKTLDRILLVFALVILFFISLSVFGVELGDSLASVYSIGIAASFIFKSAASRAFDAIMFLFVTHPYDTGDRIFIDEENLVVKKMTLFATVFSRADGTETYYFNSQLFTKFITNARRSDKTTEMLTLQVAWKTPLAKLDALEKCLNDWLSTEEKRWYQPKTGVTLQHIVYQRYLELTIGIPHNGNWQDWSLRNIRKTAFHAAVQYYCRQLGITGYEAPLPIVFNTNDAAAAALSSPYGTHLENNQASPDEPETSRDRSPTLYQEDEQEEQDGITEKGALGFVPPEGSSNLARARKSHRSRKDNLGAMNAEC